MKKKRRNPIHAYKHLLAKDYDWDYMAISSRWRRRNSSACMIISK